MDMPQKFSNLLTAFQMNGKAIYIKQID
jgi:hypothetical protein